MAPEKTRRPDPDTARQDQSNPGDDAEAGTPGTGEDICPACNGSGSVSVGPCVNCGGTGRIVEGVGGG